MPVPTPEQLDAFEAAPARIATAIEGLTNEQMHHAPAANEWSVHEVIIHLPDSEAVGFFRLRKTIAEDHPILQVYDEEAWARNLAYRTQDRDLALALFAALRRSSAALLRLLPSEAWERTATHPEQGELSLYDLFTIYVEHGNLHLAQIERLKQPL